METQKTSFRVVVLEYRVEKPLRDSFLSSVRHQQMARSCRVPEVPPAQAAGQCHGFRWSCTAAQAPQQLPNVTYGRKLGVLWSDSIHFHLAERDLQIWCSASQALPFEISCWQITSINLLLCRGFITVSSSCSVFLCHC